MISTYTSVGLCKMSWLALLQPKMESVEELYSRKQISSKLQRLVSSGIAVYYIKKTGARKEKFQQPER